MLPLGRGTEPASPSDGLGNLPRQQEARENYLPTRTREERPKEMLEFRLEIQIHSGRRGGDSRISFLQPC